MNGKKLALAGIAGFVVMFISSGIWYMALMADYYDEQFAAVSREEPLMMWIIIGYLVTALLLAYVYPFGYKGGNPVKEGLRFGFTMGLVMMLPMALITYAVNPVPGSALTVDTIYQVVEKSIGGIVIGLVYGKGSP